MAIINYILDGINILTRYLIVDLGIEGIFIFEFEMDFTTSATAILALMGVGINMLVDKNAYTEKLSYPKKLLISTLSGALVSFVILKAFALLVWLFNFKGNAAISSICLIVNIVLVVKIQSFFKRGSSGTSELEKYWRQLKRAVIVSAIVVIVGLVSRRDILPQFMAYLFRIFMGEYNVLVILSPIYWGVILLAFVVMLRYGYKNNQRAMKHYVVYGCVEIMTGTVLSFCLVGILPVNYTMCPFVIVVTYILWDALWNYRPFSKSKP